MKPEEEWVGIVQLVFMMARPQCTPTKAQHSEVSTKHSIKQYKVRGKCIARYNTKYRVRNKVQFSTYSTHSTVTEYRARYITAQYGTVTTGHSTVKRVPGTEQYSTERTVQYREYRAH